jgi:cytochrome bd ubiquinol oxidase subunit II
MSPALLAVAAIGLVVLRFDARYVLDGLLGGWGLVFVLAAVVATVGRSGWCGAGTMPAPGSRRSKRCIDRAGVGHGAAAILLPTSLTIDSGAGDPDSLRWLLIVTVVAVVVVAPALALLHRLDLTDRLAADHDIDLTEAHAAPETTVSSSLRDDVPSGDRVPP